MGGNRRGHGRHGRDRRWVGRERRGTGGAHGRGRRPRRGRRRVRRNGRPGAGGTAGSTGGATGTGGTTGAGGTTGTGGSIPSGFPTPTTANRAVCKSVAQTTSPGGAKVCPGGGDGPACIECLFGGDTFNNTDVATAQAISEAGNYAVTVALGGASAGQTQIDAETNRVLLALTSTTAGQSRPTRSW